MPSNFIDHGRQQSLDLVKTKIQSGANFFSDKDTKPMDRRAGLELKKARAISLLIQLQVAGEGRSVDFVKQAIDMK